MEVEGTNFSREILDPDTRASSVIKATGTPDSPSQLRPPARVVNPDILLYYRRIWASWRLWAYFAQLEIDVINASDSNVRKCLAALQEAIKQFNGIY